MSLKRQTDPVLSDRENQQKYVDISQESGLGSSSGNISYSQTEPEVPGPHLRPLYFEVPGTGGREVVGRGWVWQEILTSDRHILIEGAPGTGKTAIVLALVQSSCFGAVRGVFEEGEGVREVGERVVGYHFCQADNSPTCRPSSLVHSLAAQLCQAPQLESYQHFLHSHPDTLLLLSQHNCAARPEVALLQGILEPLAQLDPPGQCLVLVDGLCEAEQHRPDYGETVARFLLSHTHSFPPWLRLVFTARTNTIPGLRSTKIKCLSLDTDGGQDTVDKDISDYIYSRSVSRSVFSLVNRSEEDNFPHVFASHLVKKASGCFLYVKMMLEFIERGQIVIKSDSFKLLPQTLSEMYQLAFNIRFSSGHRYEGVSGLMSVCLAALRPLTLHQVRLVTGTDWSDLLAQSKLISPFLVTRADGSLMFLHPTLRDWLTRRGEGGGHRFLCNTKQGHAALALHLSRTDTISSPDRAQELAHHLLKSGLYRSDRDSPLSPRDLTALHLSLSVADISSALLSPLNMFSPSVRVTRLLLLAGADPSIVTDQLENSSLLGLYCHLGYTEVVRLLVEWGADLDTTNKSGLSPVCLAAEAGHLHLVRLLLDCGAARDSERLVRAAARGGEEKVVSWILDTDTEDQEPLSSLALVTGALHGQTELVQTLLGRPQVDIKRSVDGFTPLEAAANGGDEVSVKLLLARCSAEHCQRALFLAVRSGHERVVCLLLDHGAERDGRDEEGLTPLMVSARLGHVEVVSVLLEREGTGLEMSDSQGQTALSHAVVSSQPNTARRLLEAGARLQTLHTNQRSLLELTLLQEDLEMLETLLECGAESPDSLLELAMELDQPAALTLLLEKGTEVSVSGQTWALARDKQQYLLILLNKWLELGNCLFRRSQYSQAKEKYKEAIDHLPDIGSSQEQQPFSILRKSLLLNLSRCERRRGEFSSAIEISSRVVAEDQHDSEAFLTRAKAYKAAGMLEEALDDFSSSLCINPTNQMVYLEFLKLREELKFRMRRSRKDLQSDSYDSIAYIDDNSTNCSSI